MNIWPQAYKLPPHSPNNNVDIFSSQQWHDIGPYLKLHPTRERVQDPPQRTQRL